MTTDQTMIDMMKGILGYSDEEFAKWKENPRNLRVAGRMPDFSKYQIVVEVLNSHGCAVMHTAGETFTFTGGGALICEDGRQICAGALMPVLPLVWGVLDKISLGVDPTSITFNRVSCVDVGLDNGGWGEVLMEVKVEKIRDE